MDEKKREFLQPAPAGLKMYEIVQRYYRLKPYSIELLRNESDEIRYFNEMLPYRIKNSLLHIRRTSLDSFIDAAYRAEASIEEGKRNQELHNRKKGVQKHSGSKRVAPTDGDAGGSKAPTGSTGRWSATKREQSVVCHNCGKEGHIKPLCTEELRTCRGCGNRGHMVMFCRRFNEGPTSQQASAVVPQSPEQGPSQLPRQPNKPQPTVHNKSSNQ